MEKFVVQIERDKKWKGYIFEVMYQLRIRMHGTTPSPPPPPTSTQTAHKQ